MRTRKARAYSYVIKLILYNLFNYLTKIMKKNNLVKNEIFAFKNVLYHHDNSMYIFILSNQQ